MFTAKCPLAIADAPVAASSGYDLSKLDQLEKQAAAQTSSVMQAAEAADNRPLTERLADKVMKCSSPAM